jgi:hypothetical protein
MDQGCYQQRCQALRRMDDLLEATYQRYRAELKGGRDISDEAKRAQIRKDIEPTGPEVDRNAPKEFISDTELISASRNCQSGRTKSRRSGMRAGTNRRSRLITLRRHGMFQRHPRPRIFWRVATIWPRGPKCSLNSAGLGQPAASAGIPRSDEAFGVERHELPADFS